MAIVEEQMNMFHRSDRLTERDLRHEMSIMAYPFCQLSNRTGRADTITYNDGNVALTVSAGKHGLPDLQDFDLILYLVTVVNKLRDNGIQVTANDWIEIDPHEFLSAAQWHRGGKYYSRLKAAIRRLSTTHIQTNIFAEDLETETGAALITEYKMQTRTDSAGRKAVVALRLKISEWLWHAVIMRENVTRVSQRVFEFDNPTAKKIYMIVSRHMYQSDQFEIGLAKLKARCGIDGKNALFKQRLQRLVESGKLPDFLVEFKQSRHDRRALVVVFRRRQAVGIGSRAG
ncbi:MAG: replication initiator protein A [Alphaproteobacteria bacterium]